MRQALRPAHSVLAAVLLLGAAGFAAEEIIDPTEDPREHWHYGNGMNHQVVEFRRENGCAAYKIEIEAEEIPGEEFFAQTYGPPSVNPVATNIRVPNTGDTADCKLFVEITHTDNSKTTLDRLVAIML